VFFHLFAAAEPAAMFALLMKPHEVIQVPISVVASPNFLGGQKHLRGPKCLILSE